MITTIDGPVAAGKTTAARALATRLGVPLLDTGALYRCVALAAGRRSIDWQDEAAIASMAAAIAIDLRCRQGVQRVFLDETDVSEAIRRPDISRGASIVSALPQVRSALLDLQRSQAVRGSLVAEGRDTGTVVFPGADCKFFLTARVEIRARRRLLELRESGFEVDLVSLQAEIEDRDRRDSDRSVAPLLAASDALTIDSSELKADEVVALMLSLISDRRSSASP